MNPFANNSWSVILDRHRRSVEQFAGAAEGIEAGRWVLPVGDGKWTPAQITQHVVQTYEVLLKQVRTGEGLQIKTGWAMRMFLRVAVLRPIMWFRRIPRGAKAPRVLRPIETDLDQNGLIGRFRFVTSEFEAELDERRDQKDLKLTHHMFGSNNAHKALDFVAVHTEHHCRQLQECVAGRRSA